MNLQEKYKKTNQKDFEFDWSWVPDIVEVSCAALMLTKNIHASAGNKQYWFEEDSAKKFGPIHEHKHTM